MKPLVIEFELDDKTYTIDFSAFSKATAKRLNILRRRIITEKDAATRADIVEYLSLLTGIDRKRLEAWPIQLLYALYRQIGDKIRDAKRLQSH